MSQKKSRHKYIFVLGGVMSGVGKGIVTSSILRMLSARGLRVSAMKADPYLNIDAGTMNPTEHGEVFVLKSGLETDQDMGNYERFLNRSLTDADYVTSGMVYEAVLKKERALHYQGKCVEAVPHVRDEILERYIRSGKESKSDISVIEIGGTVGDFQNALFIDAVRALKRTAPLDVVVILVSYLPIPSVLGEMKTRPTQHAVRELSQYGVTTDFVVCRAQVAIDEKRREKIASSCNVDTARVISAPDVDCIYRIPLQFENDGFGEELLRALSIKKSRKIDFSEWATFVKKLHGKRKTVRIGVVGKYFDTGDFMLSDSYRSVIEAFSFSGAHLHLKPQIEWINAKELEKKGGEEILHGFDGILVPGGFGEKGIEGKMKAIRFARENNIPYFGICYGMQLALIEYARNVLGLKDAHTTEVDPKTKNPIIHFLPDQRNITQTGRYGGTMRLGEYPSVLKEGTIAQGAYRALRIAERHRHRYEVNSAYEEAFLKSGVVFSGKSPDGSLIEVIELSKKLHPFFVGVQFHPELIARPLDPHPLFTEFMKSAFAYSKKRGKSKKGFQK